MGKQPWYITTEQDEFMVFAGLWEVWKGDRIIQSFTIITKEASEIMAKVHPRMPAIIPKKDFPKWLDPDYKNTECLSALLQNSSVPLKLSRVSKAANSPRNNYPELIKSIE